MDTIECFQGHDVDWQVSLTSNGSPITSYTDDDTPSALVNSGDDTASIFSPTVEWIDSAAGTLRVRVAAANTTSLTPGRYRVFVKITTTEPRDIMAWVGYLRVLAAPGSATSLSTYCSYEDMLYRFPTLDQLSTEADRTGFQEARHEARTWLESVIQAHYRPQTVTGSRYSTVWGHGGAKGRDEVLQGYLDDDLLVVTDQVKRICAKRALGIVLRSALSPAAKEFSAYQALADQFLYEAQEETATYVAEVDSDDDGNTDIRIHCGLISHRLV